MHIIWFTKGRQFQNIQMSDKLESCSHLTSGRKVLHMTALSNNFASLLLPELNIDDANSLPNM